MIFGLVMISSVSVYRSYILFGTNDYFLIRHLMYFGLSLLVMTIFTKTSYTLLEKYAQPIYMLSAILLVLLFIPGVGKELNGAKWWIVIEGSPISIQPIEFVKLGLLVMLAFFVKKHRLFLSSFQRGFLPYFGYVWLIFLLLIMQPDFWSIMILAPIVAGIYFVAGGNKRFLLISACLTIFWLVAVYSIGKYTDESKFHYISERIDVFLRSSKEITESRQPKRKDQDHQLKQGFIAQGSGGFFGLWFWKSIQKFGYLPEVQWDFIFSVITEELGFMGVFFLIFIYLAIVYRGFYIARSVKDPFGKYLAFAITLWIITQASVNIGVNLGIVPLTGVTLPFVSYGGSSIISLSIAIGILLSISRHAEYKPQNLSDALQAKRNVIF